MIIVDDWSRLFMTMVNRENYDHSLLSIVNDNGQCRWLMKMINVDS